MNKIKDVYSYVTVDSDTVTQAIENAKKQQIRRFPVKRIIAIAAGFVIVSAVLGIAVFTLSHQTPLSSAVYNEKAQISAAENDSAANEAADMDTAGITGGSAYAGAADSIDGSKSGSAADTGSASSLYVSYAAFAADGVLVEYRVSKDSPYYDEALSAVLVGENGGEILSTDQTVTEDSQGNQIVTVHFPPCEENALTLRFYRGEPVLREETVTLTE